MHNLELTDDEQANAQLIQDYATTYDIDINKLTNNLVKKDLDTQKQKEAYMAKTQAGKLRKTYETPAISEKQIRMEIAKITLPDPIDVNVTAEVKVNVNKEQLTSDINEIVKKALRSKKSKKQIQDIMFDAE